MPLECRVTGGGQYEGMSDLRATIFLLSPANVNGRRAEHFTRKGASGALALGYQAGELAIDEAFAYISALYFRGKVAYAREFGSGRGEVSGAQIIVPGFGLVPFGWVLDAERMKKLRRTSVDAATPAYRKPLERSVRALASELRGDDRVVLLGSLATGKYLDVLVPLLGERLMYPALFAGTGDMRRGALMLRAAAARAELAYEPVVAAPSSERIRIRGEARSEDVELTASGAVAPPQPPVFVPRSKRA